MKNFSTVLNKALEASYAVAKILAKTKQPHTITECLVLPCCQEIVNIMKNESAVKEVKKVPLSDNTLSRRIADMSDDILSQLKDILMKREVFALQLDESTDTLGKALLLANVRYIENNSTQENFPKFF